MKKQAIVTRESLKAILEASDYATKETIIGRALVHLLDRQTADEQAMHATNNQNSMGFAQCDAFTGTNCAKYYRAHKRLRPWMIEAWMKSGKGGFPRITKYHRQLDEVAQAKLAAKQAKLAAKQASMVQQAA